MSQKILNLWLDQPLDISSCEIIVEKKSENDKSPVYKIKGPFLQAEIKNGNGRVYPLNVLEPSVEAYVKEKVDTNRAIGELEHSEQAQVNLERAAIKVTELKKNGNDFIGIAEVLDDDLPCARVVKGLIKSGVRFGVSSRGVGSLKESDKGDAKTVTRYKLISEDVIYDPSGPDCFVDGIVESKQYVLDESTGGLLELNMNAYDLLENSLKTLPKKDRNTVDKAILEKCFKFLNSIRNSI